MDLPLTQTGTNMAEETYQAACMNFSSKLSSHIYAPYNNNVAGLISNNALNKIKRACDCKII